MFIKILKIIEDCLWVLLLIMLVWLVASTITQCTKVNKTAIPVYSDAFDESYDFHTYEHTPEIEEEPYEEELFTTSEMDLIAMVTMGEAEGECEEGQRLVIATILNRLDHPRFPNTIEGVLRQPNQFEVFDNGRINRCYVKSDILELVKDEVRNRTNHDTIFFNSDGYSSYGTPMFKVGAHYFSSY